MRIDDAIVFATMAHEGQKRKGSETPYIFHVLEAGVIATQMHASEDVVCAALLHDVMEDSGKTVEDVRRAFGDRVAELVAAESESKSLSWMERKRRTIEDLAGTPDEDVRRVALCDKLSNIRAMDRDYKEIGNRLWERFKEKNPARHAEYYRGLVGSLATLKDEPAYREFARLVWEVFGQVDKYTALLLFLEQSTMKRVRMSYSQLESVLDDKLPKSAYGRREWWHNDISAMTRHPQCKAWLAAGYFVESVELGEAVTFERIELSGG